MDHGRRHRSRLSGAGVRTDRVGSGRNNDAKIKGFIFFFSSFSFAFSFSSSSSLFILFIPHPSTSSIHAQDLAYICTYSNIYIACYLLLPPVIIVVRFNIVNDSSQPPSIFRKLAQDISRHIEHVQLVVVSV